MPSIFDVAPNEANANNVNGNALLISAIIKMPGKYGLNKNLFFFCNSKGINTRPAIKSLNATKSIGPKSTAEIFMNINALPQIAAREINKIQSLDSIKMVSEILLSGF